MPAAKFGALCDNALDRICRDTLDVERTTEERKEWREVDESLESRRFQNERYSLCVAMRSRSSGFGVTVSEQRKCFFCGTRVDPHSDGYEFCEWWESGTGERIGWDRYGIWACKPCLRELERRRSDALAPHEHEAS